jgi:hypothetical protein
MQTQLPHVGDIKEASRSAGMEMFFDDAVREIKRHLVAGKIHHPGAQSRVQTVQGRFFNSGNVRHRCTSSAAAKDRCGAPSVGLPESVIPSADALPRLFPELSHLRGPFA